MRKIRCRNCGALQDVPDYHGPLHVSCKRCEWQETLPPRRELPKSMSRQAGAAFAARRQRLKEHEQALSHVPDLSAREFEELCGRLHERLGFVVHRAGDVPTHAFDLRRGDDVTLLACRRAGGDRPIGKADVENLAGAMRHDRVGSAVFVTTGEFEDACAAIAREAGIELIDGEALVERLTALDPAELGEILPPA